SMSEALQHSSWVTATAEGGLREYIHLLLSLLRVAAMPLWHPLPMSFVVQSLPNILETCRVQSPKPSRDVCLREKAQARVRCRGKCTPQQSFCPTSVRTVGKAAKPIRVDHQVGYVRE